MEGQKKAMENFTANIEDESQNIFICCLCYLIQETHTHFPRQRDKGDDQRCRESSVGVRGRKQRRKKKG